MACISHLKQWYAKWFICIIIHWTNKGEHNLLTIIQLHLPVGFAAFVYFLVLIMWVTIYYI